MSRIRQSDIYPALSPSYDTFFRTSTTPWQKGGPWGSLPSLYSKRIAEWGRSAGVQSCDHQIYSPFDSKLLGYQASNYKYMQFLRKKHIITDQNFIAPQLWNYLSFVADPVDLNNDFEIIQFVAELDETIKMLTTEIVQSLTYGGVSWGWLPFINDIKGIIASFNDITGEAPKQTKGFKHSVYLEFTRSNYGEPSKVIFNGTLSLNGTVTFTRPEPGSFDHFLYILDEIGFNPDLKTAWDLIPFSFVIDYFVNIGDILESLHPRSWYHPNAHFVGFRTIKGIVSEQYSRYPGGTTWYVGPPRDIEMYYRQRYMGPLVTMQPSQVGQWEAPSPGQWLSTVYLILTNLFGLKYL